MPRTPKLVAILIACLAFACTTDARAQEAADLAGEWKGVVQVPGGSLDYSVKLSLDGDAWAAVLSIPAQNASDLPCQDVTVTAERVSFAIAAPGTPTWVLERAGDGFKGELQQGGMTFPATLERGELARLNRPQEPTGELPYDVREVTFDSIARNVTLAGTLTMPRGEGPFPGVVLVSGSGPSDRDESIFGHKPFLVLSDRLTRQGIAVLRFDDRGVGESTGDHQAATSADFAMDARGGVRFLSEMEQVGAVGIVGHSEGGIIGPFAASEDEAVKFVVMLAGPGIPGRPIILQQIRDAALATGVGQAGAIARSAALEAVFDAETEEAATAAAERFLKVQSNLADDAPLPEGLRDSVPVLLSQFRGAWMTFFLSHDPAVMLREVDVPVLALFGEKDVQVRPDMHVEAVTQALAENEDVTIEVLPGLNHLFQPAVTGQGSEYGMIETTFDEDAMQLVADWINERFGEKTGG